MFTVEYRFKEHKGRRYSKWFKVSSHDTIREGREALSKHIAEYWSFDARLVYQDGGKVVGAYKYTQLG